MDHNVIQDIPVTIVDLKRLKSLSLANNKVSRHSLFFSLRGAFKVQFEFILFYLLKTYNYSRLGGKVWEHSRSHRPCFLSQRLFAWS